MVKVTGKRVKNGTTVSIMGSELAVYPDHHSVRDIFEIVQPLGRLY